MINPYLKFRRQIKNSLDKYTREIKGLKDGASFVSKSLFPAEFSIPAAIPHWLSEIFEIGAEKDQICSILSLGNLYGISYIRSIGQLGLEGIGGFFLFKAIMEYQRIFPSISKFWNYTEGFMKETIKYFEFCQQGFKRRESLLKEAIEISGNRYALQKCCVSAFCLLQESESLYLPMEEMMEYFSKALSLRNAAREWQQDLLDKKVTFPLIKLYLITNGIECSESAEDILFLEGIIEETLNHSLYYFSLSHKMAKRLNLSLFSSFLEHTMTNIDTTIKELKAIRKDEN